MNQDSACPCLGFSDSTGLDAEEKRDSMGSLAESGVRLWGEENRLHSELCAGTQSQQAVSSSAIENETKIFKPFSKFCFLRKLRMFDTPLYVCPL